MQILIIISLNNRIADVALGHRIVTQGPSYNNKTFCFIILLLAALKGHKIIIGVPNKASTIAEHINIKNCEPPFFVRPTSLPWTTVGPPGPLSESMVQELGHLELMSKIHCIRSH